MQDTPLKRRLAENEIMFRQLNERAHTGLTGVNELAREYQQSEFKVNDNMELLFFCECSNVSCAERIRLTFHEYGLIHRDKECFIVVPGHEIPQIERVVSRRQGCNVIRKI